MVADNSATGTSTPHGPQRQHKSSATATAIGTTTHNDPHGSGVDIAHSVSSASSNNARNTNPTRISAIQVAGEGQQRQHASPLHGDGDLLLVARARPGHAAWNDLAAVGDEASQPLVVLVVDEADLLETQLAVLLLQPFAFTISRHDSSLGPGSRASRMSPPARPLPATRDGAPG